MIQVGSEVTEGSAGLEGRGEPTSAAPPVPLPSLIYRSPWTQQPTPQHSHKLQVSLCMNRGIERQADVRFKLKLQT